VARRRGRRAARGGTLLVLAIAVVTAVVALSHTTPTTPGAASPSPRPTATRVARHKHTHARTRGASRRRAASGPLSLVVEPDAGPGPVYDLLRSARRSVDVEIYELEDGQADAILAADAARGVRVRVLLNEHYVGRYNRPAFAYLQSHGVAVRWAPSRFDLTHEKAIVVDGRRVAIMSMNLTARYYADTRDFVLLDGARADVAAVTTTFDDDWANGGLPASSPADLVWSPGAQDALVALIDSARHRLLVENEEMDDDAVTSALQAAARRGVAVEVVMTRESSWAAAFGALARAGVAVRTYAASAALYIHAKAIVVDPGTARARAFVGSQNFSAASLLYNRELGLVTSRPAIVAALAAVIARDGAGATPWRP
jgi:phosphatidylserine/phosphatidylglycerophosphate/cardiolipin synthase-like enzyme